MLLRRTSTVLLASSLLLPVAASRRAEAQQETAEASGSSQGAGERARPPSSKPATQAQGRPSSRNPSEAKKEEGEKKDASEKDGEDESKVVKRPEKPPQAPDPSELEIQPDETGRVQFNFRGQPWADVLEWLARTSGKSLDWQELPGDYLNLTTQRKYTLEEARDLLNRHLLARGYTMIQSGEMLSVVKIEEINPGMVPRVQPEELSERMPHEFVKVSLPLDWMVAEQAAEELEPLIGPHGTLTPLPKTNRLEAMDAVVNLRQLHELLEREQSSAGQKQLVREFELRHTRAAEVLGQLETLLGIKSSGAGAELTPQQLRMLQQAMQRQQQRQRSSSQQNQQQAQEKEPQVHLVANSRTNSILAHAPPDKMAVIEQAVQTLDVPRESVDSLLTNPNRMQVYRLHAVDPETLVSTLQELGELGPRTRLDIDERNKAIIAYASLADHMTIRQLVERLDGSGRKFEVIKLQRLPADYVAGTIEFMMIGDQQQEQRRSYSYSPYSYRYGRQSDDDQDDDQFRVDADVENNYLLLWANEIEIEEVMNLLMKLGEVPAEGGDRRRFRILDEVPQENAAELLERLQRAWPSLSPNPLQLPDEERLRQQPEKEGEERPDAARQEREVREPREARRLSNGWLQFAHAQGAEHEAGAGAGEERPPVSISIGPDGSLIARSDDPQALDLLEELIRQLAPPQRDYEIFYLKHADAYWVKLNLEEYFGKEEEDAGRGRSPYFFYGYAPQQQSDERHRLSRRRELKFIYDLDTNSILVQGADRRQLRTIEDLIEIYDQPESSDAQSARMTSVFHIRHSQAETIAETIKDVYRDLLSSNDKALANNNNPEQRNRAPASGTTYIIGSGQDDDSGRTQVTFKGKLSIGVDSLSNTLIVSTEGEHLMRNVSEMIETLDQAAQSSATVSVVQVPAGTSSQNVAKSLAEILGQPQAAQPRNGEQQDRRAAQQQQRRVTQEADQAGRRREQPE